MFQQLVQWLYERGVTEREVWACAWAVLGVAGVIAVLLLCLDIADRVLNRED